MGHCDRLYIGREIIPESLCPALPGGVIRVCSSTKSSPRVLSSSVPCSLLQIRLLPGNPLSTRVVVHATGNRQAGYGLLAGWLDWYSIQRFPPGRCIYESRRDKWDFRL